MDGTKGIKINLSSVARLNNRSLEEKNGSNKRRASLFDEEEDPPPAKDDITNLRDMNVVAMEKKNSGIEKNSSKWIIDKALEEDPDVFDYDKGYCKAKENELRRKMLSDDIDENGFYKPKYYNSIISAAARRKLELERTEIKNAQNKRKLEENEHGETNEFITPAYKKKLSQMENLEIHEKLLEESRSKNREADMIAFYKDILNKNVMSKTLLNDDNNFSNGSKDGTRDNSTDRAPPIKEHSHLDESTEAYYTPTQKVYPKNSNVEINDSNEVVDKTQLFKGGLNITHNSKLRNMRIERDSKPSSFKQSVPSHATIPSSSSHTKSVFPNTLTPPNHHKAFLKQSVLRQKEEVMLKESLKRKVEIDKIKKILATNVTESLINTAKERYAARKVQQQQQSSDESHEST